MGETRLVKDRGYDFTPPEDKAIRDIDAVFAISGLTPTAESVSNDLLAYLFYEVLPSYDPKLWKEYFDKLASSDEPRHRQIAASSFPDLILADPVYRDKYIGIWLELLSDANEMVAMRSADTFFESLPRVEEEFGQRIISIEEFAVLKAAVEARQAT